MPHVVVALSVPAAVLLMMLVLMLLMQLLLVLVLVTPFVLMPRLLPWRFGAAQVSGAVDSVLQKAGIVKWTWHSGAGFCES